MERKNTITVVLEYSSQGAGDLFVTVPDNLSGCIYKSLTDAISEMKYSRKTPNPRLGARRFVDAIAGIEKISHAINSAGGECMVKLWNPRCFEQEITMNAVEFLNQYDTKGKKFFSDIVKESTRKNKKRRAMLAKKNRTNPSQS
jgi:hypothetical protein